MSTSNKNNLIKSLGKLKHFILFGELLLITAVPASVQAPSRPKPLRFPFNSLSKGPFTASHVALHPSEEVDTLACIMRCSRDKTCSLAVTQRRASGRHSCVHLYRHAESKGSTLKLCKFKRGVDLSKKEPFCEHGYQMKDGVCVCRILHTGQALEYEKPDRCNIMSKHIFFDESPVYRGRYYLFRIHNVPNAQKAQEVCGWYGGYLAEIDDESEDDFVRNIPYKKRAEREIFWLGGTDKDHEGNWTFQRTGKSMNFLPWPPGQPDDGTNYHKEDCMSFTEKVGRDQLMRNDVPCTRVMAKQFSARFICEISLRK